MSSEGAPPDLVAVLAEQQHYYAARALEYDESYLRSGRHDRGRNTNADWFADMARLEAAFDRVALRGEVVELAAGTGVWTERLVERVDALTAIDASTEALDENRRRLGASASRVVFDIADLFEWRPSRTWDGCVFAFWLAKVPDVHLAAFLGTVADALRPGGAVCCVDKTAAVDPPREYEVRTLNDGRQFTIVDHPRTPARIAEAFAAAGLSVVVETFGSRFSLAWGTKT